MFDLFLKIFLLFSPIFWMPMNGLAARFQFYQYGFFGSSINLLQLQFFQYGTVILFLVSLFNKPVRSFQDKFAGALLLFFILGVYNHPKTIVGFSNILLAFLLYYLVTCYTKDIKSVLRVIVFVAFLNSIFAIMQSLGIFFIYRPTPEIIGLMLYKSQLGIYQAIAIPICYAINPWLALVPVPGLLLSKSTTALIPAIFSLFIIFKEKIVNIKSMPMLMLLMSASAILIIKAFVKLSIRFDVWFATIKMIWHKIFIGYGIGTFQYITNINGNITKYPDPYSVYLQIAHGIGIGALIVLLIFIWDKMWDFGYGIFAACMVLLMCGAVYGVMDYARLAGTAIVLFGFLNAMKGDNRC